MEEDRTEDVDETTEAEDEEEGVDDPAWGVVDDLWSDLNPSVQRVIEMLTAQRDVLEHEMNEGKEALRQVIDDAGILEEDYGLADDAPLVAYANQLAGLLSYHQEISAKSHMAALVVSQCGYIMEGQPIPADLGRPHPLAQRLKQLVEAAWASSEVEVPDTGLMVCPLCKGTKSVHGVTCPVCLGHGEVEIE